MDFSSSSLTLRLTEHCPVCGGPLHEGPLGPRCPRCVFALSVEVDDLDEVAVAQLFPELEIEGKIARGGFGTVFRAQHRRLKRAVALKFLDPGLTHSPEAIARFELEMESVGRLDHAGIVRAYDAGEREGRWFIVMEHVDGEDLATLSRREGPLEPAKACRLIHEAARSLAYAHERGLVHRDVKPSNIMLSSADGVVKLLDFGLAVTVDATLSDYFSGTPDYAAPEQIATPREVDARADVFGLGATLFRLLTGQAPHVVGGEVSMTERMARITRESPPPVQTLRKDLPAGLPALVDRLLAMDRTKRPQSAAEVAALLAPFAGLAEKKSTKWPLVTAVAVFGLAAVFWPAGEKAVAPPESLLLAPKPTLEPPGSLAELKQKSSVIPAVFKSAKDVPVTGVTCDVSGLLLDLKLEFAPEPGMNLTALRNTGHDFIQGEFANVKNGQRIELEHAGKKHPFTAWYYGGNGNDLVLLWPHTALAAWGYSGGGMGTLGNGRNDDSNVPVEVDMKGVLRGKTVVALAAGLQHTLALSSDGKLYAWGNNMFGQLGDGSTNTSPRPLEVRLTGALAGKKVVSVAAGGRFSLALCADGTVAAWGANDLGQLGAGSDKTLSREPLAVDTSGVLKGKVITQVRAGLEFAVALSSEGEIFAWGQNKNGILSTGVSGPPSRVPVAVSMGQAEGRRITDLFAASCGGHALALTDEGMVYGWGLNNSGQVGSQKARGSLMNGLILLNGGPLSEGGVVGIAGGGTHSVFLLRDGRVATLGGNHFGQLGIDARIDSQLPLLVDTSGVLSGKKIRHVAAGADFTAVLSDDGQIFTWGANAGGKLGNQSQEKDRLVAVLVNREPGVSALAGRRVCDSGLYANGNGCTVLYALEPEQPQTPPPVSAPKPLTELRQKSTAIPAVFKSVKDVPVTGVTCDVTGLRLELKLEFAPEPGMTLTALRNTGHDFIQGEFENVKNGQRIELEHAGKKHPFTAWYYGGNGNDLVLLWPFTGLAAWGGNISGTLGNGLSTDSDVPVNVLPHLLAGKTVVQLAAGMLHTLALTSEGKIYAWGENKYGQLGGTATESILVPLEMELRGALAGKKVVAVAAGNTFSLALTSEGRVVAWGGNDQGQLGDGSERTFSAEPVEVESGGVLKGVRVAQIAAGVAHGMGLTSSGAVVTWGSNNWGHLGIGRAGGISRVPVALDAPAWAGRRITDIASGALAGHSLAVAEDGTLYGWGLNFFQQVGVRDADGDKLRAARITHPVLEAGAKALSAGVSHSVVLTRDERVVCFGGNDRGQLGIGMTGQSFSPMPVDASGPLKGREVTLVKAGSYFSAALTRDGQVFTWGSGVNGRLGIGMGRENSLLPVAVSTENGISALAGRRVCDGGLALNSNGGVVIYALDRDDKFRAAAADSKDPPPMTASRKIEPAKPLAEPAGGLADLKMKSSTITAVFKSATDVPVTGMTCDVTGLRLDLKLEFAPEPGMNLTALRNSGHDFIQGEFTNLKNGQRIELEHAGKKHPFTVWYYGGNGNDLVLLWPHTSVATWGHNREGMLGHGQMTDSEVPVAVHPLLLAGKTIVQISLGRHCLALTSEGQIYAWGYNRFGQLGNNSTYDSRVPVEVDMRGVLAGKKVVAVAAGMEFSLALTSEGKVMAWGYNEHGQVGNGSDQTSFAEPVEVDTRGALAGARVTQLRCGGHHALVLTSDGRLLSWGANGFGAVGTGNLNGPVRSPVEVVFPEGMGQRITDVWGGAGHSLAVTEDGTLYGWGANYSHQSASDYANGYARARPSVYESPLFAPGVAGGSGGAMHNAVFTLDGRLVCFGSNDNGELGIGSTSKFSLPVQVELPGGVQPSQLAAGSHTTAALTQDGQVFTWGNGQQGRLGQGPGVKGSLRPVALNAEKGFSALAGRRVSALSMSNMGAAVIYALEPGEQVQSQITPIPPTLDVVRAKYGAEVQVMLGAVTGVPISTMGGDASGMKLALNLAFAPEPGMNLTVLRCAGADFLQGEFDNLKNGQEVELEHAETKYRFVAWYHGGSGNDLTLLCPKTSLSTWGGRAAPIPGGLLAGSTVTQLSGGSGHTLALTTEGKVHAWGENGAGQLGDGTTTARQQPVLVDMAGQNVVGIAAAPEGGFAITREGRVYGWGANAQGQLGDGTRNPSRKPVAVAMSGALKDRRVTAICAGRAHTLALSSSGKLYAWGANDHGQLGTGDTRSQPLPVKVDPEGVLADKIVTALACGPDFNLVLTTEGKVYAWGDNRQGQLGSGLVQAELRPRLVEGGLTGRRISGIACGTSHALAVSTLDARVYAWGANDHGQLGSGSYERSLLPVEIQTDAALRSKRPLAVSAGQNHSLLLTYDGQVRAWGAGAAVDAAGTEKDSPAPVLVDALAGLFCSAFMQGHAAEQRMVIHGPRSAVKHLADLPRLAAGWEIESVIECPKPQRTAQFMQDGSLISVAERDAPAPQVTRWVRGAEGWVAEVLDLGPARNRSWRAFVHPESGHFVLTEPSWMLAPDRLARYTPEGKEMPDLLYSDRRYSSLEAVAFVRAGAMAPGAALREGDILVADAGSGPWAGKGSLWRARLDNDEPLELLTEDELLSAPVDVAVNRHGVYLFNRNKGYTGATPEPGDDLTRRVIRWDGGSLIRCQLSEPVRDPSALVAAPGSSGVLYAAEGSSGPLNYAFQRVLKLMPGKEPDSFQVEEIASMFGKLYGGALAIHPDGSLLAVTDHEKKRIYLLRRKAE
jgi:alpha-tubulin suppressor-like RCC1 family protein/serine/threonine protein kinase